MIEFPEIFWTCRVRGCDGRFLVLATDDGLCRVTRIDSVKSKVEWQSVPYESVCDLQQHWAQSETAATPATGISTFREWMDEYDDSRPWHRLLRLILGSELKRHRDMPGAYKKAVFKDRDDKYYQDGEDEPRLVAELFHLCRTNNRGCLRIGEEVFWLLGFQWPNQGGDEKKGMRADLVALSQDNGLVVFECKLGNNPEPPFKAMIQGLDYLCHLLRKQNFKKICDGFKAWRDKTGQIGPHDFGNRMPDRDATPYAIVLAPAAYYQKHETYGTGEACKNVMNIGGLDEAQVRLGFAVSDFSRVQADWFNGGTQAGVTVGGSGCGPCGQTGTCEPEKDPAREPKPVENGTPYPRTVLWTRNQRRYYLIKKGPRNCRIVAIEGTNRKSFLVAVSELTDYRDPRSDPPSVPGSWVEDAKADDRSQAANQGPSPPRQTNEAQAGAYRFCKDHQKRWAASKGLMLIGSAGDRGELAYTRLLEENLFEPLSAGAISEFEQGDGKELVAEGGPPKMHALHSSAALTCNLFHYWRHQADRRPLVAALGLPEERLTSIEFEAKRSIMENAESEGFPMAPNLDVVVGVDSPIQFREIGFECKFTDPYWPPRPDTPAKNGLKEAYLRRPQLWDRLTASYELAQKICPRDDHFKHLHAAQLLKHVLGLKHRNGKTGFSLCYLWYDVRESDEASRHRQEIAEFRNTVAAAGICFRSLTFQEVIAALSQHRSGHEGYVDYLVERYM